MSYTTYVSIRCRMIVRAVHIIPENLDQLVKAATYFEIRNSLHKTFFKILGASPEYIAEVLLTGFLNDYIELDFDQVYQVRRKSLFESTTLPYDKWRLSNEGARCFSSLI